MAKASKKADFRSAVLTKKLSSTTIMGGVGAIRKLVMTKEEGDTIDLYSVIGSAFATRSGESDMGEWVALIGMFEVKNMHTGEITQATKLFLPDVVNNLIAAQVAKEGTKSVQFAFMISAKREDESATGYSYTARSLVDLGDPLKEIREAIANGGRAPEALPAPETAAN